GDGHRQSAARGARDPGAGRLGRGARADAGRVPRRARPDGRGFAAKRSVMAASTGRFSSLLLEGLDEYRRGNMQAAVRAWGGAYTLEPTNPRAREFLHSALERIYAQMGVQRQLP